MPVTYAAQGIVAPPEVYITPFSRSGMGATTSAYAKTVASTTLTANRAYYFPIFIPRTVVAYRLFALNGATAGGTDNRDIGIYRSDANRLPSTLIVSDGGTAISGANVCQYEDIADTTLLGPALYYIALAHNGATDTVFRSSTGTGFDAVLMFQQNTAFVLPSTATPIAGASGAPVCGITLRASP